MSASPQATAMQTRKFGPLLFSVPIWACVYALIISPLLLFFFSAPNPIPGVMEDRHENKIFWIMIFTLSLSLIIGRISSGIRTIWPTPILCLLAYLAFAGVSILWAFSPQISFIRFAQQLMVVASIIFPAILLANRPGMLRPLFLCFAAAVVLNILFFAMFDIQIIVNKVELGFGGYFKGKNYVGECAAAALLLSLHELAYPGPRRAQGIAIAVLSVFLMVVANSKTAMGLATIAPIAAAITVMVRKTMRISPAALVLSLFLCYYLLSAITGFNMNRLAYIVYGDSTFTGRQTMWSYAASEIAHRPLLGWGYQSFWLVGPAGPSVVNAPGWVKTMPNAHNGYYDALLEMGYVGLALLCLFLAAILHGIGRIADRDAVRAWGLLSLVFYIMMYNGFESIWMRGFEFLWVTMLILTAEIARCLQPIPTIRPRVSRDSRHLRVRPP